MKWYDRAIAPDAFVPYADIAPSMMDAYLECTGRSPLAPPAWALGDPRLTTWARYVIAALLERAGGGRVANIAISEIKSRLGRMGSDADPIDVAIARLVSLGVVKATISTGFVVITGVDTGWREQSFEEWMRETNDEDEHALHLATTRVA